MPRVPVKFVGQAYQMSNAPQIDSQNCINWYLSTDATGKNPIFLLPRPGSYLWANDNNNYSVRGQFESNGILYVVVDNEFRVYDSNGNYHKKGVLDSSVGNVSIIFNDTQAFITDGKRNNGYVYQLVKSETHDAEAFFRIENASSSIGEAVFVGAGINDMTSDGTYIGTTSKKYRVEIDSVGTDTTPDTFKWSDVDGDSWNVEKVVITANVQELNDGVTVQFDHTTSHTLNDYWKFDATIDSAFYVPIIAVYQDQYGIYLRQQSNQWGISAIGDFSQINALDFAFANAVPDNLVAGISVREELWLLGRESTGIWYNTGAEEFPFERRTNLVMNYGCLASYSLAHGGNDVLFWLSINKDGGRQVVMAENYIISPISTEALNIEIAGYAVVDDAKGWVEQWDGHLSYVIVFPTADRTWVYDLTVSGKIGQHIWNERRTRYVNEQPKANQYRQGRWLANNHVYFAGKHLIGDWQSGKIYEMSRDSYTDNDVLITRQRTTKTLQQNLNRVILYSLTVDFEVGRGLTTGLGEEPKLMLQISRDGGRTWGNELWRTSGKIGKYKHRVKWNRLGSGRSFTFRLTVTDPVFVAILSAVADMEDTGS